MALLNWLMRKSLQGKANTIADYVANTYPRLKLENHGCSDALLHSKLMWEDLSFLPEDAQQHVLACCESLEGTCYFMALQSQPLKGMMLSRCLQFTKYMDDALYAKGFKSQSKDTKVRILKLMDLYIPDWEKWCR